MSYTPNPAERSPEQKLAALPPHVRAAFLAEQDEATIAAMNAGAWWWVRRPKQHRPPGDWLVHLIMAGRGWGKGRAGSEELVSMALEHPYDRGGHPTPWLLVGETFSDVKKINVEGVSGIQPALTRLGYPEMSRRAPHSKDRGHTYLRNDPPTVTIWPDGQQIVCQSADDPDVGRGYNFAGALLDEMGKWGQMSGPAWTEGILPSLRADVPGWTPRATVTTTPRPLPLLRQWVKRALADDPLIRLTTGATFENVANLPSLFVQALLAEYEGTRIGRQELHGELLDDVEGALWTHDLLDRLRVKEAPKLERVVVGVDPAGTESSTSDEMGVVVVGATSDGHLFVTADHSRRSSGMASARHAWQTLIDHRADWIILEEDYGKKYLKDTFTVVYREMQKEGLFPRYDSPPIKYAKAAKYGGGKKLRAEPVAMRYEAGRVHHVGTLATLEDQMASWDPSDPKAKSPDRVDALVYACLWLRDQEGRHRSVSSAANNLTLPVTRLTPLG